MDIRFLIILAPPAVQGHMAIGGMQGAYSVMTHLPFSPARFIKIPLMDGAEEFSFGMGNLKSLAI